MFIIILGIAILLLLLIVGLYYLGILNLTKTTIFYVCIYSIYILYMVYLATEEVSAPQRTSLYHSDYSYDTVFGNLVGYSSASPRTPRLNIPTRSPRMTEIYSRDIKVIVDAYKLGFPLELGEPTDEWVINAKAKLERLGERTYYTIISENNKIKIAGLLNAGITLHDEDTMTESIYHYNSFDLIPSLENGHLYVYTRPEWQWILENKICPFSRTPIPDIVIQTIQLRTKMAQILPPVTTLGNGILNINISPIRSPIEKLSQSLDLHINPIFSVQEVPKNVSEIKEISNSELYNLSDFLSKSVADNSATEQKYPEIPEFKLQQTISGVPTKRLLS
jgi:hypothetical protein